MVEHMALYHRDRDTFDPTGPHAFFSRERLEWLTDKPDVDMELFDGGVKLQSAGFFRFNLCGDIL